MIVGVIVITATLSFFIESFAEYIPFDYEVAVSKQLVEKLDTESNEVDDYLQQLADQIVVHMDLPEGVQIKLHYVNEDVVNAMATLGGHIMVYRGLLEKLPNENALVMLLGHEIGHVKMRHPVKALGKGVIISLLMSVILGETSDSVASVISESSLLTLLSFSRDQEQLSDQQGIHALNAYYGHVQEATTLFEILQQQHDEEDFTMPQFLNTHPDTQFRINHLQQLAQQQQWEQQGEIIVIPEHILQILADDKESAAQAAEDDS